MPNSKQPKSALQISIDIRREKVAELLTKGDSRSNAVMAKELGISPETFRQDIIAIGERTSDIIKRQHFVFAHASLSNDMKRRKLIKIANDPEETTTNKLQAVKILDAVEQNWHDFLFKIGVLVQAPERQEKAVTITWNDPYAKIPKVIEVSAKDAVVEEVTKNA